MREKKSCKQVAMSEICYTYAPMRWKDMSGRELAVVSALLKESAKVLGGVSRSERGDSAAEMQTS